jgi:anti-anti-sigma factor
VDERDALASEYARMKARLDTMPVIEQAKGIIMARERCGPEQAFDLLRQASQRANLKVYVLAAFLVEQTSGHTAQIRPGSEPREDGGRTAASTTERELTADGRAPQPDGQGPAGTIPGTVVVPLPGELTFSNVHEVKTALEAAFGSAGSLVVADGTATVFCDSAGMHELIRAHKHAAATGTAFRVVIPHANVRDRLIRTGLNGYLPVYPALAEALLAGPGEEAATG